MDNKKFEAILNLVIPQLVHIIVEKHGYSEVDATRALYESNLYETLEQEDTKLWQLSPLTLLTCLMKKRKQERSLIRRDENEQRGKLFDLLRRTI